MMIASFFLFMLLHGSAVCNELYPISVVEDIIQEQPEWSSDNYIEPLGETKLYDEANPAANPSESGPMATYTTDNKENVGWMKTEIVDYYKFKKDPKFDIWTYQPDFKNDLGTPKFSTTSKKVEEFFKRNRDRKWDDIKVIYCKDSCTELLYITAARYMLVTYILYEQSNKQVIPCVRTPDKKIMIPASVCYPAPYGSATCTSDYDVGLIGKDAGLLVAKFNEYFQDVNGFGKPSEFVFDTNVYAYSLEFAMPALFVGLPNTFADDLKKIEGTDDFKMQELASAYYKVFKYNELFFQELKGGALEAMKVKETQHTNLVKWLEIFSQMDATKKMKRGGYKSPEEMRNAHNEKYQGLLQNLAINGGYDPASQDILARAEIYAAEAYHTRGAIRHIVGVMQMRVHVELTINDMWVSMIENWGESNKEYNLCGNYIPPKPKECFLKMSKYLWRMFTAMERIHGMLQKKGIPVGDVMNFSSGSLNPTWVMMVWNSYKKKAINVANKKELDPFLTKFSCGQNGLINLADCMVNMQKSVMGYNKKLASLELKQPLTLPKINIGEGIKRK